MTALGIPAGLTMNFLPVAGDAGVVSYSDPDLAEKGIARASGGAAEHVVCCLGGYQIIEADTDGVRWTDLRDYMLRHNCTITIRRIPNLDIIGAHKMVDFWISRVGYQYSFSGDAELGAMLVARKLGPTALNLTEDALKAFHWDKLKKHEEFCSQLWADAAKSAGYFRDDNDLGLVAPLGILQNKSLNSIMEWNRTDWSNP